MKKITVSIGIPAYFAQENIEPLLKSLVVQEQKNQKVIEILVFSDGSTDNTVKNARKVKDKRIKIIDSNKRGGMAKGLLHMLSIFKGNTFLLLNDDIVIRDKSLVDKMAAPLLKEEHVGLVGGNPQPFKGKTFVEKSGISAFDAYSNFRYSYKNGNSKYTCDGKLMLLTRDFIESIRFPKSVKKMGNVDIFLYLSCIENKFLYRFVKNAEVLFQYPASVSDYINWVTRNNSNTNLLKKRFGKIVDEEFYVPKILLYKSLIRELADNPIQSLFIFILGQYCNYKAKNMSKDFSAMWNPVNSTKNLKHRHE